MSDPYARSMPFYRVRTVHSGLVGGPYLSTHYFDATSDGTQQDAATLVESFWDDLKAIIAIPNAMNVENVVQTVQETTGNIINEQPVTTVTLNGTNPNNTEWTAKQGVLSFRTNSFVGGRRLYGRTFVPGVCGGSGEQQPVQAYIDAMTFAGQELIDNSNEINCPMVAVRRPKEAPFTPGAMAPMVSATGRNVWGVLRSRRT